MSSVWGISVIHSNCYVLRQLPIYLCFFVGFVCLCDILIHCLSATSPKGTADTQVPEGIGGIHLRSIVPISKENRMRECEVTENVKRDDGTEV